MRVTFVAVGTRGDVQPQLALAVGLQRAGHRVRFATTHEFEGLVRGQGVPFALISGSPSDLMHDSEMMAAMGGNANPVALVRGILGAIRPLIEIGTAEVLEASQDAELIVPSLLGFYCACHVAEKLEIPLIETHVLPGRPSRAFTSPLLSVALHLGGLANRLSFILPMLLAWQLLRPVTNRARRRVLDLPSMSYRKRFKAMDRRQQPVLHAYSPLLLPKPPDWPPWYHVTGWWFLERAGTWQPPEPLLDFLGDGPSPVCVGFGSMTGQNPGWFTEQVLEALRRTGQRGLLLTGWGGMRVDRLPQGVYSLASAPHDWLFPRMAAVVHHGGSGTTAAGLRAGIPSILVPFGGDQYLWGRRVHAAGVGPAPIPRTHVTADNLTRAIAAAVSDGSMRDQARLMGARIRAEDGVGNAVRVIERSVL